jgi:hypothetical protein
MRSGGKRHAALPPTDAPPPHPNPTPTPPRPAPQLLGARPAIKALYGAELVHSPCVRAGLASSSILDVKASDWSTDTAATVAAADAAFCTAGWGCSGTPVDVPVGDNEEHSLLGVAEYMGFFSAFFDAEPAANAAVGAIAERFACAGAAVAAAPAPAAKPRVLWAYEYAGTWAVASCPNYYCELVAAAGGELLLPSAAGSGPYGTYTLAEVAPLMAAADVWLYPGDTWDSVVKTALPVSAGGTASTSNAALTAALSAVPALAGAGPHRVFDLTKSGTNAWFETRIAQPDAVLQDLISIITPAAYAGSAGAGAPSSAASAALLLPTHSRIWFRNVFTEEAGALPDVAECTDAAAPFRLQGDACPIRAPFAGAADAAAAGLTGGAIAGIAVGCSLAAAALVGAALLVAKANAAAAAAKAAAAAAAVSAKNPAATVTLREVGIDVAA